MPGWDLHPLQGNLSGHWSVKVSGNWRLTFVFEGNDGYYCPSPEIVKSVQSPWFLTSGEQHEKEFYLRQAICPQQPFSRISLMKQVQCRTPPACQFRHQNNVYFSRLCEVQHLLALPAVRLASRWTGGFGRACAFWRQPCPGFGIGCRFGYNCGSYF
jgi:proteic killer suppression protein